MEASSLPEHQTPRVKIPSLLPILGSLYLVFLGKSLLVYYSRVSFLSILLSALMHLKDDWISVCDINLCSCND